MADRKSRQNPEIRDFILRTIARHPLAVGSLVVEKFGISRTAANRYLKRLEAENLIAGSGKTSARRYELKPVSDYTGSVAVVPDMYESEVWRVHMAPHLRDVPQNVENICHYGFTEMFNNVIDHSGSPEAIVSYTQFYDRLVLGVIDHGVGIFEKIQADFGLPDPRSALLELAKGKLTSDRTRHSGEGIFFTSRMFNAFSILSGALYYSRTMKPANDPGDDWGWLIETHDVGYRRGTIVRMEVVLDADWTTREVFEKYQDEEMNFSKTHVPVSLGLYAHEQLVSRSQAKRILARFDKFEEVLLDFKGVPDIGQAFADEIFRVYANAHPEIRIVAINTSPEVERMIGHAKRTDPSTSV
ncbi:MAG: DUF4325 domain-containing protein [Alphaproteobacteria bacterium]|nr:DUF4325 domain-containing protein [Alphaproteobacteria bacterium]